MRTARSWASAELPASCSLAHGVTLPWQKQKTGSVKSTGGRTMNELNSGGANDERERVREMMAVDVDARHGGGARLLATVQWRRKDNGRTR